MSNMFVKHITTRTAQETEALAAHIGKQLRGGEMIELVSDLGGGKTTFVRGLAQGAGSTDRVASPTFTVSKVYKTPKLEIHHFDFYRLHEGGMVAHELAEVVNDPHCVVVVEWGDIIKDVLPAERMTIRIRNQGENVRDIIIEAPESLAYCLKDIA